MTPERAAVEHLAARLGERVRVCGWIDDPVAGGLWLREGTEMVRLRTDEHLARETAVEVLGTVVAGEEAVEVAVDELTVVSSVLAPVPLTEESSLEERLDLRFLDLRRPRNQLVFRVQTTAERAMREVWYREGFVELHSPKIRPTPNKSGRELFTIGYFGRPAYLAQSPQFYKQMAMASGFERVFEIGPVFRANPLITSRHDTEFTSVDIEMSWINSVDDVMAFEERWLRHVIETVAHEHGDQIARTFGVDVVVPALPFPRLTLEHARRIAEDAGIEQPPGDLDASGERAVGAHFAAEHGHQLVFVTRYPVTTRPFYHMRVDDDPTLTRSFDLLWNGMEVTTGAQREHRRDRLERQAEENGIPLRSLSWYLDFFTYGCPPHGGFGFGLTRMLTRLFGLDDVREVTYLHRGPQRLMP
ncbi:MAG: aspartate--tRNA(Asn) ligase [Actinomycetota bacterium]|nr:aspartate--tRNA(Asn) ligase [Actinomycetota bacterium]